MFENNKVTQDGEVEGIHIQNIEVTKYGIRWGGKSKPQTTIKEFVGNIHNRLITLIVGKKPVMMNLRVQGRITIENSFDRGGVVAKNTFIASDE